MNKIVCIVFALCALQLAQADVKDDIKSASENLISDVIQDLEATVIEIQQSFKGKLDNAKDYLKDQIGQLQEKVKQDFQKVSSDAKTVEACVQAQESNFAAVQDEAESKIKGAALNQMVTNILPLLGQVNNTIAEAKALAGSAVDGFSACADEDVFAAISCYKDLASTTQAQLQPIKQELSQERERFDQIMSFVVKVLPDTVKSIFNNATQEVESVQQQISQCIQSSSS